MDWLIMGSLKFLKSASGSSVSTLSFTGCFPTNFNTFVMTLDQLDISAGNAEMQMRFIDSSQAVISDTEYDYAYRNVKSFGTYTSINDTSVAQMQGLIWLDDFVYSAGALTVWIYNPTDSSEYTYITYASSSDVDSTSSTGYGTKGTAVHKSEELITGVHLLLSSGTMDSIKVNMYGVV